MPMAAQTKMDIYQPELTQPQQRTPEPSIIVTLLLHMSQKDYNALIIENLLKESNHVRGIAEDIGTNQTTVSRELRELCKENAVNYRYEG